MNALDASDVSASRFDVIVIGVGGMGSAACYLLARRGVSVLGLEQFGIPHSLGSSHGHTRAIRMAYYEHPDYVPLLRRSYELWGRLQEQSGIELLTLTGGLYIGREPSRLVSGSRDAARLHNLPHENLTSAQISARFPQFHLPNGYAGMYEEKAGIVRPDLAVGSHVRAALNSGAEVHAYEPVLDWSVSAPDIQVTTTNAVYTAQRLVVCGGPWSSKLIRDLGISLTVTRQLTAWVSCKSSTNYRLGSFPFWAIALDDESLYYGFPEIAERPGVKIAHHKPGHQTHPDGVNRETDPSEVMTVVKEIQGFLPDMAGPILSMDVCLYTNSPDAHFIVDKHPQHEGVFVACGFSGHGFKFAPVIGEVLADLAMYGKTSLPIEFLGFRRFVS
jgi:sarcosine oxidase